MKLLGIYDEKYIIISFFHDSKDIIDVITYPWSHGIFYTEKAVVLVRLKKQNNSKYLRSVKIKKNRALEKLLLLS